jgi:hypothetical protein
MTVRPPLHAILVALLLGALSAFTVACGQDSEGLIAPTRASEMQDHLDAIEQQIVAGRCDAVKDRLAALRREINELPGSVDRDLRQRLREGLESLESQAPEECRAATQTTTQPETTPETAPTETLPPEAAPTETTPPETTPPETTPPEPAPQPTTPPETTPPAEPTLPPESGGEEAPSGAVQEGTG